MLSIRRPPFWASVLTLCAMIILCMLGTWQIKRLAWKEGLIAELSQTQIIDAEILNQPVVAISPRTYDGEVGRHIYAPLRLDNGRTVAANLGWIAQERSMGQEEPCGRVVRVQGVFVSPPRANFFTPHNDPSQGHWYHPDLKQMAQIWGVTDLDQSSILIVTGGSGDVGIGSGALRPLAPLLFLRNNHMQYAIFWFSLSFALFLVFIFRFVIFR